MVHPIAHALSVSGSSCKVRWGNIRDNFRKSLNKQKTKSGQKAKNVKPYKYSQQLQFVVKYFEDRETITNLEEEVTNQDSTDEEQEEFSEHVPSENEEIGQDCATEVTADPVPAEDRSQKASTSTYSTKTIGSKRKKMKQSNDATPKTAAATLMEYIVKTNEKKEQSIPFPPQDHIDAFLAGIAPVLKKLPPKDWFYAKGEIFAVVQKYEYNLLMNNYEPQSGGNSIPSQSSEQLSHTASPKSTLLGFQQSTPSGHSEEKSDMQEYISFQSLN